MGKSRLTLIETILTVAVVCLTAAILWPVSGGDRVSAKKAACISNLKQLSMASIMYKTDFDDHVMLAATWADDMSPFVKNKDLYRCPETFRLGAFGYAFSRALGGVRIPDRSAADTIMIFDSTDLSWNANGDLRLLPSVGRHQGGNSGVAFADGHASSLTRQEIYDQHRRSNGKE